MLSTVIVRSPNFRRKSLGRHHGSMINRDLPDEVVIQILQRLPEAKSVIRCKLVCRNWYRIISAATFIRRFLNHHHHHNFAAKISHFVPQSHRLQSDYFPVFILPPEQLINKPPEKFNPFLLGRKAQEKFNFTVVASCNDLLLCRLGSETEYCICNPLTKQYTTLPPSPKFIREEGCGFSYAVGFSCDPYVKKKNPDGGQVTFNPDYTYRVVLVYNCFNFNRDGTRVHDFSSETNEWRVINPRFRCVRSRPVTDFVLDMSTMIFCKGMGFYINRDYTTMKQICIYNPQNNTLRAISVPREENKYLSFIGLAALGVCRGFLRFLQLVASTRQETEEVIITARVWELDGNEQWREVHNVYLHQLGDLWHSGITNGPSSRRESDIYYDLSAIAIDPNDADIIYIRAGEDRDIVSCNLREMEMKHIQGPFVEDNSVRYPLGSDLLFFPVMAPLWPTPIRLPAYSSLIS